MSNETFLDVVVRERRADAAQLDRAELERAASSAPPARSLVTALRSRRAAGFRGVIAEVKRISPAMGKLSPIADPAALATRYADAGATAISVLTEQRHWGGSLDDLRAVRAAVQVPVLCKDVIVDERQVLAARAAGADAVLLIAEALDDAQLGHLLALTKELGMDALVEAHEVLAFRRLLHIDAELVGVNARDLRNPATLDLERIHTLAREVRSERLLIAESGIGSRADAERLPARVDGMLVGSALVAALDPAPLLRALADVPIGATS